MHRAEGGGAWHAVEDNLDGGCREVFTDGVNLIVYIQLNEYVYLNFASMYAYIPFHHKKLISKEISSRKTIH